MAITICSAIIRSQLTFLASPTPITTSGRCCLSRIGSCGSSTSMDEDLRAKFMEFPYASPPIKNLMVELLSTVDTHLRPSLHPHSTLPRHVQHFGNPTATAHASLHLRSGLPSSQIDFILGGWIHCKLPSGGSLNITSLSAYLNPSTNAPHFLLELIQSSPSSLVLILDLTPRKDLVMYPDYLKKYYEDTDLDKYRQRLQALQEVTPYVSPSLYIRAAVSPSAVVVTVESANTEEIIRDHVSPVAKELVQFWIDSCACLEGSVGDAERCYLAERDGIIKKKTLEVDLGSSFPRLFGQQVADGVLDALKEYYNK